MIIKLYIYRFYVCTIFIYHAYSFDVHRFYVCTIFEYRAYTASKLSVFIHNSIIASWH